MRIAGLLVLLTATTARAETPSPDPVAELAAIAAKVKTTAQPIEPICSRPTKAEAAALEKRLRAWVDQRHPEEELDASMDVDFDACRSGTGMIADISEDRMQRKGERFAVRRHYIVRATGDKIDLVIDRQTTAMSNWMEWAEEGRLRFVTELDMDGDGALDLVWSDFHHEGGAVSTDDTFFVRFAATGKDQMIARVSNLSDERVAGGQLVVAGQSHDSQRVLYACVGKDLRLAPCAASVAPQRAADRIEIAGKIGALTGAPDHDLVVDWLATLGAKVDPALLAKLPATTPQQRAERHVAAFLASRQLDETFQTIFFQPHPEATAFFDQLATQLGDTRCTPTPLTDPARAKLADWIAKQDKAPVEVELTPECGMYAWVEWNHKGDNENRNEVLVALDGPAPIKVAKFKQEPSFDGPRPPGHQYDGMFFQHGDTTVGVVIRSGNVSVIANDKVVAQSHGEIRRYGFDRRWVELGLDVIVDSGTLFHPSPTGLDKLDRALVADREAQRKAIERLLDNPPSSDPQYLAALRTLGAGAKLVAECKKLSGHE